MRIYFIRSLVGYSSRVHAYDSQSGLLKYQRWQHTWWSGIYSIVLTKVSFLHRNYLEDYMKMVPPKMLRYIDTNRNCEDIAMAHIIASKVKFVILLFALIYDLNNP